MRSYQIRSPTFSWSSFIVPAPFASIPKQSQFLGFKENYMTCPMKQNMLVESQRCLRFWDAAPLLLLSDKFSSQRISYFFMQKGTFGLKSVLGNAYKLYAMCSDPRSWEEEESRLKTTNFEGQCTINLLLIYTDSI